MSLVDDIVFQLFTGTMSQPASGLSTADMKVFLGSKTLAGNCLVVAVDYVNGVTITSVTDDQGSTWPSATVTEDAGASQGKTSVYVLPNCVANITWIRFQFSAPTNAFHMAYNEIPGLALSSVVAQSKSSHVVSAPSVAAGSFTSPPAAGNLIWQYGVNNKGGVGAQDAGLHNVSEFRAGASFRMLGGDINNISTTNAWALQARIADGTALNATFTAIQTVNDTFNTIALELVAAVGKGTKATDGNGIPRIRKLQFYVGPGATNTFWTEFFPHGPDATLAMFTIQDATTTLNTDSQSNVWSWHQQTAGLPLHQSVRPAATGSDKYTMRVRSAGLTNNTYVFADIANAKRTGTRVGAVGTNTGTTTATDVDIRHAPDITPQVVGSLILCSTPIGHGPLTALLSPTPAAAMFLPVLYDGETDFDTMNNADGYAWHITTDLSAIEFRWQWNVAPWPVPSIESWQAAAVEYFGEPPAPAAGGIAMPIHQRVG